MAGDICKRLRTLRGPGEQIRCRRGVLVSESQYSPLTNTSSRSPVQAVVVRRALPTKICSTRGKQLLKFSGVLQSPTELEKSIRKLLL